MTCSIISRQSRNTNLEPIAQDLPQTSSATSAPEDIAFGPDDWNRHFGDVGYKEEEIKGAISAGTKARFGDIYKFPSGLIQITYDYLEDSGYIPPLPKNITEILQAPCPFYPDKKVEETHLLVLIPKTVNGKPFTLNLLQELIQNPKEKNRTCFMCLPKYIKKDFGDAQVEKSYWMLMTKEVIPESLNKTYEEQKELVQNQDGYEIPGTLEATIGIFMHYFKTGERLYEIDPQRSTRCKETLCSIGSRFPLRVGDFAPAELSLSGFAKLSVDCSSTPSPDTGIAAIRKI